MAATGRRVALVSSGAVGAGIGQLGLSKRPDNLRQLQAAAAVGQAYLIRAYDEGFRRHGRHAAQLLLTHEDFDSRPRYLNMRNTLTALFEYDAVPVINENDTISVDEIKFGDNDKLAAMVANLLQAPLLVILSVVDGLCRADPGASGSGEVVPLVPNLDDESSAWPATAGAAAGPAGCGASSRRPAGHPGRRVGHHRLGQEARAARRGSCEASRSGRLFLAQGQTQGARKRWIGSTARPRGFLVVDPGARVALERGDKSLLAIGIVEILGDFEKGDVVGVRDLEGREFARGLIQLPRPRRPPDRRPPLRAGPPRDRLGLLRRGHPPRQPRPDPIDRTDQGHRDVAELERDVGNRLENPVEPGHRRDRLRPLDCRRSWSAEFPRRRKKLGSRTRGLPAPHRRGSRAAAGTIRPVRRRPAFGPDR